MTHNERKGAGIGIKETVTTIVVVGILFVIGVLVFSKIDAAIPDLAPPRCDNSSSGVINISAVNSGGNCLNSTGGAPIALNYLATEQASEAVKESIASTVLDSLELAVIALIVLAAIAILAVLFMLG